MVDILWNGIPHILKKVNIAKIEAKRSKYFQGRTISVWLVSKLISMTCFPTYFKGIGSTKVLLKAHIFIQVRKN